MIENKLMSLLKSELGVKEQFTKVEIFNIINKHKEKFLTNSEYDFSEIFINVLNNIQDPNTIILAKIKPTFVKVGDTFVDKNMMIPHPALVIRTFKNKDYSLSVPLTSSKSELHNFLCCNSRFHKDCWFSSTIKPVPNKEIIDKYIGMYDCPKDIREFKQLYKQYINKLL